MRTQLCWHFCLICGSTYIYLLFLIWTLRLKLSTLDIKGKLQSKNILTCLYVSDKEWVSNKMMFLKKSGKIDLGEEYSINNKYLNRNVLTPQMYPTNIKETIKVASIQAFWKLHEFWQDYHRIFISFVSILLLSLQYDGSFSKFSRPFISRQNKKQHI